MFWLVSQEPAQQSLSLEQLSPAPAHPPVGLQPVEGDVQMPGLPGVLPLAQQRRFWPPHGPAVPVVQVHPSHGVEGSEQ